MASENEQGIDRRRALGVIGKTSAAAAVIGVPVGAVAAGMRKGSRSPADLATVRRELASGRVPMEEILPDDIAGAELVQAGKVLEHRIGDVARIFMEGGRAEEAHLVAAKHSMHRARAQAKAIVTGVSDGTLRVEDARAKGRALFETYFGEMKALGAI